MVKQLLTTNNAHGLTPFKEQVWNPLAFLPKPEEDERPDFDAGFFSRIEAEIPAVLAKYGLEPQNTCAREYPVRGFEVGDDRVDLSFSTVCLGRELIYQEQIFRMKTSWKDTYISERDWNFCEVTSAIPASPYGSMDYARKVDSLKHLDFTDSPILRLIGNVQKGDRSHSSSATGKASMLARRLRTPRSCNRPFLMLACWIQDGCLNTVKNSEPKYLEGIVGGAGCPPLWDNPVNSYLYVRAYKSGSYARVYGTAINEARDAVNQLDAGRPASVILCKRLREKQEYLHATYASSVLIAPKQPLERLQGEELPPPLYVAAGSGAFVQAAERRLLAAKRTITRTQAEVEMARTERICTSILGLTEIKDLERLRRLKRRGMTERFEMALSANAAVQALLKRCANGSEVQTLIGEGFLHVGVGVVDITKEDVFWLCSGGRGEVYTVQDIIPSEDMFVRAEISTEESLKVPGIQLWTRMTGKSPLVRTTQARVGLWQVSTAQEEWSDRVVDRMLHFRELGITPGARELLHVLNEDREWVSDDSILIEYSRSVTMGRPIGTLCLVSADIRLAKHMATATGFHVVAVHPESVIKLIPRTEWSSTSVLTDAESELLREVIDLRGRVPRIQEIFLDTGSFSSSAMRIEKTLSDQGLPTGSIRKVAFVYEEYTSEGRQSRTQIKVMERSAPFTVQIVSANGTLQKMQIRRDVAPPAAGPGPTTQSRFKSLTSYVPRRRR